MTTSNFSIPISAEKNVRPTGEMVSKTSWDPSAGETRQYEIDRAREIALQEHKKRVEDATTVGQRLVNLENKVGQMEKDIQKLLQLLGAKNVSA